MKRLRITVTKDDIIAGQPEIVSACPVVLAIRRATGCDLVRVFGDGEITIGKTRILMPIRGACARFVQAFDAGRAVRPFVFYIPRKGAK